MIPENTIICGDCLEVMKDWPDNCVDLVVTSPPYNLVREWSGGGPRAGKQWKSHSQRQKQWYEDNMPEAKYLSWQRAVVSELVRVCKGSVFYNNKVRYAIKRRGKTYHPYKIIQGHILWCEIIWDRSVQGAGNWPRWFPTDERIYQLGRPIVWNGYAGGNIWRIKPNPNNKGHPSTFPLEIPKRCVLACSGPEHIVLDPFSGSGTTCVAAKMLGRRYIGIDISEKYCEIARQRLEAVDTEVPAKERQKGQIPLFNPA